MGMWKHANWEKHQAVSGAAREGTTGSHCNVRMAVTSPASALRIPLIQNKAERPCNARAFRIGGEGGILREGSGQLVFQTALLRAVAPRGGQTPHCGLCCSALRIPLVQNKAERPCNARAFRFV